MRSMQWQLGTVRNHPSICSGTQGNQEEPETRWPVTGPCGYRLLASLPATYNNLTDNYAYRILSSLGVTWLIKFEGGGRRGAKSTMGINSQVKGQGVKLESGSNESLIYIPFPNSHPNFFIYPPSTRQPKENFFGRNNNCPPCPPFSYDYVRRPSDRLSMSSVL